MRKKQENNSNQITEFQEEYYKFLSDNDIDVREVGPYNKIKNDERTNQPTVSLEDTRGVLKDYKTQTPNGLQYTDVIYTAYQNQERLPLRAKFKSYDLLGNMYLNHFNETATYISNALLVNIIDAFGRHYYSFTDELVFQIYQDIYDSVYRELLQSPLYSNARSLIVISNSISGGLEYYMSQIHPDLVIRITNRVFSSLNKRLPFSVNSLSLSFTNDFIKDEDQDRRDNFMEEFPKFQTFMAVEIMNIISLTLSSDAVDMQLMKLFSDLVYIASISENELNDGIDTISFYKG